ncbi:MAG: hypothetical protein H0W50_01580 [Parachlamydiaceae bacterium]|nr:hypothetical protein [Parachlamydiaceae bacterium]
MKFIFFIFFCLFVCILSFYLSVDFRDKILYWFDNDDKHLSKEERLVNQILYETSSSIEKTHQIKNFGTLISMPGGRIQKLGLSFNSYQKLSKEKMRTYLLEFGEKLLHNITLNEEIQPFLNERPFTIENVEIYIYNHDEKGHWPYDPEIGLAHLYRGKVIFKTYHHDDKKFGNKNESEETYEEALQLVPRGDKS